MGSPIGRYERDLQRYRRDARRNPLYDESAFKQPFCVRTAIHQLEHMLAHNPTSVTQLLAMLNELGSVYARVTHSLTKDTRPGDAYLGPTTPHPRDLRQFVLFDVVGTGLPVLLTKRRNRQAAQDAFERHLKPLLRRAIEILKPLLDQTGGHPKAAA
jgi:hypothetical protein